MTMQREVGEVVNPYVPPGHEADADVLGLPVIAAVNGYQDQTLLVRILMVSIGLQALTDGFNAFACGLLAFVNLSLEAQEQLVSMTGSCAQLNRIFYFIGTIPFVIFLVRANQNARCFMRATRTDGDYIGPLEGFSPASMVWWFFVPFLNLVRPYQAVSAVWVCSAPDTEGIESTYSDNVVPLWWAAWIIGVVWSRLSPTMTRPGVDPQTHNVVVALGGLLGCAVCFFALRMLLNLQARQHKRAGELWGQW